MLLPLRACVGGWVMLCCWMGDCQAHVVLPTRVSFCRMFVCMCLPINSCGGLADSGGKPYTARTTATIPDISFMRLIVAISLHRSMVSA